MPTSLPDGRLSRSKIVDAVTQILEDSGVDAVSTRTIGERLKVHPTALYRHFRDMDELLREAADGIMDGVAEAVPDAGEGDALDSVAELCRKVRAVLMAYPGAARVIASGPSRMANERAITEKLLSLLSATTLPAEEVALAYHALIEFTVGSSAIDAGTPGVSLDDVNSRHRTWRAAYLAASPDEFPHSVRFATSLYPPLVVQFDYALDLMIAGLRQKVDDSAGDD